MCPLTLRDSGPTGDGRGEGRRRHRDLRLGLDLPAAQHECRMTELVSGQKVDAGDPSLPRRAAIWPLHGEQHRRDLGHTAMTSVIDRG